MHLIYASFRLTDSQPFLEDPVINPSAPLNTLFSLQSIELISSPIALITCFEVKL